MDTIVLIVQIVTGVIAVLVALMSFALFFQFRWPAAGMWGVKVFSSALSSLFVLVGLLIVVIGVLTGSLFITAVGSYVALIYFIHFISVTRPPLTASGFEKAFGNNWNNEIKHEQKKYFLSNRTILTLPAVPSPRLEQNIPFSTIPGTDRELLCDVWLPHKTVKPSGLAFVYLHGSAFYILDKDYGTRPFFRHLAAQGHVIMDVAYRLAPETDLTGMIHDVKRAVVWMKENSGRYAVNQDRIIVGGGSAGGYLALMAAYTGNDPRFTPTEVQGKDAGCCAVIAEYPATDLEALYYHTNQHLTTRSGPGRPQRKVPTELPGWLKKRIGEDLHRLGMDKGFENVGTTAPLMGGHPDQCPGRYKLFSPIEYVDSNCPPTLFIQGNHDIMTPIKSTSLLFNQLTRKKVPAILHILPQTDHAFDLLWPKIAPAAHNAFYDIERFMALMSIKTKTTRMPSLV